MSHRRNTLVQALGLVAALGFLASPLAAQGKSKHYTVTSDRALVVTKDVLSRQGFEVIKVTREGETQIVYYRLGNRGQGKGKGKLEKMLIRREADRVVFVDTPSAVLVDIDIRLRL